MGVWVQRASEARHPQTTPRFDIWKSLPNLSFLPIKILLALNWVLKKQAVFQTRIGNCLPVRPVRSLGKVREPLVQALEH